MNINLAKPLSSSVFAHRREKLLAMIPDDSVVILATTTQKHRNGDTDYPYRADSSFFYLTGFSEPQAVLLLQKSKQQTAYYLFVRSKDKEQEIWEGKRAGIEGAKADYLADDAFDIQQIDEILPNFLLAKKQIFARFCPKVIHWLQLAKTVRRGMGVPTTWQNLDSLLDEMRLIKQQDEIALMQTASDISALAHINAMKITKPNLYEYQLAAEIEYTFAQYGCQPSYQSIVASGDNANILHYIDNNQRLQAGDLVMIDAGVEYQYYAGDISRTFPVSGKFSDVQKQVYQIVLQANLKAIDSLKVGEHCKIHHETALRVLTQGLIDLGILTGSLEDLIKQQAYLPFFMHGTGHWLGMDVHDVGSYVCNDDGVINGLNSDLSAMPRKLQAGMVLTVEPGLYFAKDNPLVPEKYRGIGIRIEDNVLITEHDAIVLTHKVPKTIQEIEQLMKG